MNVCSFGHLRLRVLTSILFEVGDSSSPTGPSSAAPNSSFIEDVVQNEVTHRNAFRNVWSDFGLCYRAYIGSVAVLDDEQSKIFERNLGVASSVTQV